jgi:predicted GNAT superfamily acetyltransferase
MTQWEHAILRWSFAGLLHDDWPKAAEFRTEYERASREQSGVIGPLEDPVVDELRSEYWQWREGIERDALNAYGAAGYELVSYQKDHKDQMHALFKRERSENPLAVATTQLPPPIH